MGVSERYLSGGAESEADFAACSAKMLKQCLTRLGAENAHEIRGLEVGGMRTCLRSVPSGDKGGEVLQVQGSKKLVSPSTNCV